MVQEASDGRLCAVERVQNETYALCRLHADVTRDSLVALADCTPEYEQHDIERKGEVTSGAPWWAGAARKMQHSAQMSHGMVTLPQLKMQRVEAMPQTAMASPSTPDPASQVPAPLHVAAASHEMLVPRVSPEETLRDLAEHYMESLYIERTSLAYFTKGPLSRARAAFSSSAEQDLIDFLRQSILTSAVMDSKYREAVVATVKEILGRAAKALGDKPIAKRKGKKWKSRRSKDGFFGQEKDYVERWWRHQDSSNSPETVDAILRSKLPKIRVRETFLQIILLLEVLALESSARSPENATFDRPSHAETQTGDTPTAEPQSAPQESKSKLKRIHDLPTLLERMLDKLCIWHSFESQSPARIRTGETLENDDPTNDVLRSFCIEVIIPFYMPRIPNVATLVNKKLGGPSAPTPTKRKSMTSRKPGDPASRHVPAKKSRTPLARVPTDTLNQSAKLAPPLYRSATDSQAVPYIKRESTETQPVLSSIPLTSEAHAARRARPSSLLRVSSSTAGRRVMDLSAMAQASEAKLRKNVERTDMIKEAVEGIKKPNRALAVKEAQGRTDESFAKAVAQGSRTQQHRVKIPDNVGRQEKITATPAGGIKRDAQMFHADMKGHVDHTNEDPTTVPLSSTRPCVAAYTLGERPTEPEDLNPAFAIPQTGHRPRHRSVHPTSNSLPTPSKAATVQDTPSRGFARFMPLGLASQPGSLPAMGESPVARRTSLAVAELSTPVRAFGLSRMREETPIRKLDVKPLGRQTTSSHAGLGYAAAGEEESIYSALGWDD